MIDKDLADLFAIETKVLNQAVKRNMGRFPSDFMFQLTKKEKAEVVTNCDHLKGLKFSPVLPYAFTEQGVIMLSNVINSNRAIQASIQVVRTFIKLREILTTNIKLRKKIESMEKKYDSKLRQVFDVLKQLLMQETRSKLKQPMGFIK